MFKWLMSLINPSKEERLKELEKEMAATQKRLRNAPANARKQIENLLEKQLKEYEKLKRS